MHETSDKAPQTRPTEWNIEKTKAEAAKLQAEARLAEAEAKVRIAKIVMSGILTAIALVFAFIIAMSAL